MNAGDDDNDGRILGGQSAENGSDLQIEVDEHQELEEYRTLSWS